MMGAATRLEALKEEYLIQRELQEAEEYAASNPEPEGWVVDTDERAEYALDRIRDAEAEVKRMEILAKAKKKEIDEKVGKVKRAAQGAIDFFTGQLQNYFKTVNISRLHKTKTQRKYVLLSGELIEKDQNPDYDIDKETLLAWAKKVNKTEYVKVTEEPIWGEIKKNLEKGPDGTLRDKLTGMPVEGVKEKERPAEFKLKY